MMYSHEYVEGWNAAYDGKPQDSNPYFPGSMKYIDWNDGWEEYMNESAEDNNPFMSR